MKAKITKKDGTVIELEGTAAELAPIIDPQHITVGPAPKCPGIGDKDMLEFGKLLDELTKVTRPTQPYQPQWPLLYQPLFPYVYNDTCMMGGAHEYPTVWNGIVPPPCSKCGKSSGPMLGTTILCTQTIAGKLVETGTEYITSSTCEPMSLTDFLVTVQFVEPQS